MDLSFARFDRTQAVRAPACVAVLLVGAVARQATGATARMQSLVDAAPPRRGRFAPASGSFDPRLAEALARWKEE